MQEHALYVLADVAWKGATILALAALAALALRGRSAAGRHWIWTLAFTGLLLVPVSSGAWPSWRHSLLPAATPPAASATAAPAPEAWLEEASVDAVDSAPAVPARATAPRTLGTRASTTPGPFSYWLALWALGFVVIGSRLVHALWSVRRLVRRAEVITSRDWRSSLSEARQRIGCRAEVRLLESAAVKSPIVVGSLRPAILLPVGAATWSADQRLGVLLHELAHVRRRDCVVQALSAIACTLHWFNPLAWLGAARLRTERERATDDLVLATGTRPSEYAGLLLELARSMLPADRAPTSALSVAEPSDLGTRIARILDARRDHGPLRRAFAGLASLAALGICAPLGVLTLAPVSAAQPLARPQASGPAQILSVDSGGSPEERQFDGAWWALCPAGAETRLRRASVRMRTEPEVERGFQMALPRDCPRPLALVRNIPGLAARALPAAQVTQSGEGRSHSARVVLASEDWQLRTEPRDVVSLDGGGHQLVVQSSKGVVNRFHGGEKLVGSSLTDWHVVWAGDLDGDGRTDLIVQEDEREDIGRLRLYLSSEAAPGQLLRAVATTMWGGC